MCLICTIIIVRLKELSALSSINNDGGRDDYDGDEHDDEFACDSSDVVRMINIINPNIILYPIELGQLCFWIKLNIACDKHFR